MLAWCVATMMMMMTTTATSPLPPPPPPPSPTEQPGPRTSPRGRSQVQHQQRPPVSRVGEPSSKNQLALLLSVAEPLTFDYSIKLIRIFFDKVQRHQPSVDGAALEPPTIRRLRDTLKRPVTVSCVVPVVDKEKKSCTNRFMSLYRH